MDLKNLFRRTSFKNQSNSASYDAEYKRFKQWCLKLSESKKPVKSAETFNFDINGVNHKVDASIWVENDHDALAYTLVLSKNGKRFYWRGDIDELYIPRYIQLRNMLDQPKESWESIYNSLCQWFKNAHDGYEDGFVTDTLDKYPEGLPWGIEFETQYSESDNGPHLQLKSRRIKYDKYPQKYMGDERITLLNINGEYRIPSLDEFLSILTKHGIIKRRY